MLLSARGDVLTQFPRISHDIGIMGGKPCIAGTRITVGMILLQLSEGVTHMELLAEYPQLTREDIYEAIRYAAWAVGTREELIVTA